MMFLACNQVIATSHPQTIVMGRQFFDPSVVKHPPHRVPASFIYAEQDGHKIKFQQNLFGEMIKVIGNHSIMNSANDIEKISFNLEPWVTTLLNSKTHTIIDLTENGLVPMSDIILEENYKKRMNYTSSQIVSKRPHLTMPKIEIMRVLERYSSTGEALYDIAPVLITRQGDRIILRMKPAASISDNELKRNENSEVFTQKALAIKEQKGNFYELEITANPIARLNPSATSDKYICVDLKYMDEKNMAVYTNSRTGMQYIYDRQNRIAFSHYIDELDGDWILDEYGIRTWVESLPAKNISMASLASSYHIIGL